MDENCLVRSKIVEKSGNKSQNGGKCKKNRKIWMEQIGIFQNKVKYSSLNASHSRRLLIDKW